MVQNIINCSGAVKFLVYLFLFYHRYFCAVKLSTHLMKRLWITVKYNCSRVNVGKLQLLSDSKNFERQKSLIQHLG